MHCDSSAWQHICAECGKSFTERPSKRPKYCSLDCRYQSQIVPLPERFWAKADKGDGTGCWLWTGATAPRGYGSIGFRGIQHRVPRLALELAGLILKEGECALHTCDTPACVRNDEEGVYVVDGVAYVRRGHLWVGTLMANNKDMILKGRLNPGVMPGEQNGRAKLSEGQVLEILSRCDAGGATFADLGREYGVSATLISKIHRGELWSYLTRSP